MTITVQANPIAEVSACLPSGGLIVHVYPEGDRCVIQAMGELDVASRNQLFVASTAGNHPAMVIDLTGVTFMDCSGYGCVVASRLAVEGEGRALTIRGQTGQPARLLDLIAALERFDTADGRQRSAAVAGEKRERVRQARRPRPRHPHML